MKIEFETLLESTERGRKPLGTVVLRKKKTGTCMPYVTHFHNLESGGHCSGEYFQKLEDAWKDYKDRCEREGVHLSEECHTCFAQLGGILNLIHFEYTQKLEKLQKRTVIQ